MTDKELEDKDEIMSWLQGIAIEPPDIIKRAIPTIAERINAVMAFYTANSLARMRRYLDFLEEAERRLYDLNDIIKMSDSELKSKYEEVLKLYTTTMDFGRKFVVQAQKANQDDSEEVDKLRDMLKQLPKETLEKLLERLERGDI